MIFHARSIVTLTVKLTLYQIWDLFEHNHLFKARNTENKLDDGCHLAEMMAILGDPPLDFLARSEKSRRFWYENGLCFLPLPLPMLTNCIFMWVNGKARLLFQITISSLSRKGSKAMKRTSFWVSFG